jgi:PTS system fructose-specific IIC component/PTS system nitrogen regulatory IIA component
MFLNEVFAPNLVKLNMEAEDKEEAFEELCDLFCRTVGGFRSEVINAVKLREEKLSTGIKQGIALPHGNVKTLTKLYGVIGVSKKGIDYEALDGEPVHLLFMLLAPDKETEKYLRLLKHLAILLDNEDFYDDMLTQADSASLINTLRHYEERLIISK